MIDLKVGIKNQELDGLLLTGSWSSRIVMPQFG